MTRLVALAGVWLAIAHAVPARTPESVTFKASNGQVIQLNRMLVMPHSEPVRLQDCGDEFQVCLTDGHRFAFSYFRSCSDAALPHGYERLRFPPKIVSALHGNFWMVFDASPNFMFHYVEPIGLVGIYVGTTPTFDFRMLLRKRNLHVSDYDRLEYRIVPRATIGVCKE